MFIADKFISQTEVKKLSVGELSFETMFDLETKHASQTMSVRLISPGNPNALATSDFTLAALKDNEPTLIKMSDDSEFEFSLEKRQVQAHDSIDLDA